MVPVSEVGSLVNPHHFPLKGLQGIDHARRHHDASVSTRYCVGRRLVAVDYQQTLVTRRQAPMGPVRGDHRSQHPRSDEQQERAGGSTDPNADVRIGAVELRAPGGPSIDPRALGEQAEHEREQCPHHRRSYRHASNGEAARRYIGP